MSEAGGARGGSPEDERRRLIERSMEDEELRRRLLADPKGTIEEEIGARLPEEIEVRVVEETPEVVYLVLPPRASVSEQGGELSDRELEVVAGGWGGGGTNYNTCAVGDICIGSSQVACN